MAAHVYGGAPFADGTLSRLVKFVASENEVRLIEGENEDITFEVARQAAIATIQANVLSTIYRLGKTVCRQNISDSWRIKLAEGFGSSGSGFRQRSPADAGDGVVLLFWV